MRRDGLTFLCVLTIPLLCSILACERRPQIRSVDVPQGYMRTLHVMRNGRLLQFGPFIGYYFKPVENGDFTHLNFLCFNERNFYTDDLAGHALLFRGQAKLTKLEPVKDAVPQSTGRIRPVSFDQAPPSWLKNRPEPQDMFTHFHSMYDRSGATFYGYWLRHEAQAAFTYNMGGRVHEPSPLHHVVEPGPDRGFARLVEFDFGPENGATSIH